MISTSARPAPTPWQPFLQKDLSPFSSLWPITLRAFLWYHYSGVLPIGELSDSILSFQSSLSTSVRIESPGERDEFTSRLERTTHYDKIQACGLCALCRCHHGDGPHLHKLR